MKINTSLLFQFMAVYDYDPTKNSPQDHPNSELQFTAGDVITVYGRQRADGFYHGEVRAVSYSCINTCLHNFVKPLMNQKKLLANS